QPGQRRPHLHRGEIPGFLRQGIDAGMDEVLRDGQLLRELRQGEDRAVVPRDELPQERPGPPLWSRGVDMAPPYPSPTLASGPSRCRAARDADQRGRLRIGDDDDVTVEEKTRRA